MCTTLLQLLPLLASRTMAAGVVWYFRKYKHFLLSKLLQHNKLLGCLRVGAQGVSPTQVHALHVHPTSPHITHMLLLAKATVSNKNTVTRRPSSEHLLRQDFEQLLSLAENCVNVLGL